MVQWYYDLFITVWGPQTGDTVFTVFTASILIFAGSATVTWLLFEQPRRSQ